MIYTQPHAFAQKEEDFPLNKTKDWIKQTFNKSMITFKTSTEIGEDITYVLFRDHQETNYYVLLQKKDNEEKIIEYGYGKQVPYTKEVIINDAVKEADLEPLTYLNPFESYWQTEIANKPVYIDGSTGNWLPDISSIEQKTLNTDYMTLTKNIKNSHLNSELQFDPYQDLTWLLNKQQPLTKSEILETIKEKKQVMFIGTKYNRLVHFAYPIIGWQSSENNLYIAVYDTTLDSVRFLSYKDMEKFGEFRSLKH